MLAVLSTLVTATDGGMGANSQSCVQSCHFRKQQRICKLPHPRGRNSCTASISAQAAGARVWVSQTVLSGFIKGNKTVNEQGAGGGSSCLPTAYCYPCPRAFPAPHFHAPELSVTAAEVCIDALAANCCGSQVPCSDNEAQGWLQADLRPFPVWEFGISHRDGIPFEPTL